MHTACISRKHPRANGEEYMTASGGERETKTRMKGQRCGDLDVAEAKGAMFSALLVAEAENGGLDPQNDRILRDVTSGDAASLCLQCSELRPQGEASPTTHILFFPYDEGIKHTGSYTLFHDARRRKKSIYD